MRHLTITIQCGDLTCAESPGNICLCLRAGDDAGKEQVCILFPSDDGSYTRLAVQDDFAMRCDACINSEMFLSLNKA